jgi:hypothetical protein
MAKAVSQQSEPARRRAVIGPWAFCLLSPAFCLLPAGCAPDDFASNDPYFGVGPPVRPPSAPAVGAVVPAGGVVPPLPQPAPSGTPAALTGATRGPLDPSRDLRIGSDTSSPSWQPAGGAPGVALQPPQPVGGGPVPLQPTPLPTAPAATVATAPTYEQLMAQLRQRGVSQLVIKPDFKTGEVTGSCFLPSKADPSKQQRYDVSNAHDPVSAMQALLEKIDTDATGHAAPGK